MSQYYWGKPDTSVSFCEKKYDTLFWIAEYYNTISAVPYIFIGMAFYCTRIKNIGICLMFLGLSTMLMHGTLRYYGQWLDEIGLIVLSFESLKQLDKRLKYIFLPPILGIYFMFTENFLDGLHDGPFISLTIISNSSPISAKYLFQLSGNVGSALTNFIYISSIKALLDLLRKAVFLSSRFLEEDIIFNQYKPRGKIFN